MRQIPERRMHAKGSGAFGTFRVTHDITKYTKANIFNQQSLHIYSQHIDGEKEVILKIESKKNKSLFPNPQQYEFDLSMVNHSKSRWWKVITPAWQEGRSFQNLEVPENERDNVDFYSWCGESLDDEDIKSLHLISERKIKKLWDYESSDLSEIFSDRLCQMLTQMNVKNIEYYPVTVTCKATKEASDSYYKLANIVGLVDGILFYEDLDFDDDDEDEAIVESKRVSDYIGAKLKAEKQILDSIEEKIIRCKGCPQIFIVDNDIKEACEANLITGIQFEEIGLIE